MQQNVKLNEKVKCDKTMIGLHHFCISLLCTRVNPTREFLSE